MLTSLKIKNYALIDQLEIDFSSGLMIITGETGAGKSIIMEALELLMGERADSKVLKNKEEKCVIEGEFLIQSYQLQSYFNTHELDYADSTIIRREINQQGKSRAFINDSPVNLSILRLLTEQLIDIHSQHETLDIGKSLNQLEMLDGFAGIEKKILHYQELFSVYQSLQKKLTELQNQEYQSKKDLDYFLFQFNELEEAHLKSGDLSNQESELEVLSHSEEIKSALNLSQQILDHEASGVHYQIKQIKNSLLKVSSYHPEINGILQRLEAIGIELKDIDSELNSINDQVHYDPEKIQILNDRINLLSGLMQKHRVKSDDELISIKEELNRKINAIGSLEDEINKLINQIKSHQEVLLKEAESISSSRKKIIPSLEKNIHGILSQLNMADAQLKIELQPLNEPAFYGMDSVRFMFNANKGGSFQELNKIASGGEFSRLMLALKSTISKVKALPTLIFDEIDTGVSGEVAHKMGAIMREMGASMQVFCITHLPQVAGKGNAHYKVFKQVNKNVTSTQMIKLNQHQRIEEVAKMLSGEKLSEAAMANARELIIKE